MGRPKMYALPVALVLATPGVVAAEEADEHRLQITCDVALADVPFNTGGWSDVSLEWPSMTQSQGLSKCVYQLGHKGVQAGLGLLSERPLWQKLGVIGFDLLMPGRPFGTAWMHEEWHRSVMTVRGIASYNEVYDLEFFGGVIRVSHVKDADLAQLKAAHNPDLVRLAATGIESVYELNTALEKDEFFRGTSVYNRFLLWLDVVGGAAYVGSSLINTPDDFEKEGHASETTEDEKDFVGHDVTGWVYDLHRPDEPYEARGVHPGGAGVDRYISRDDLSDEERRYLKLTSGLTLLNFVDPFLFGKTAFHARLGGHDLAWNASLRHHLTSFGQAVGANLFLRTDGYGDYFVVAHSYYNAERMYVGLEGQLVDHPLPAGLRLTSRVMAWQQPRDQRFRTSAGTYGGLVSARLSVPTTSWLSLDLEVEAKSAGWVAGNPYLGGMFATRLYVASTF